MLQKIHVYIFSVNDYYKHSNYKIRMTSLINEKILERNIIFKGFEQNIIDLQYISDSYYNLYFIICNEFLLDRKCESWMDGNTRVINTSYVDGEPGSAGNWNKEDYDNMLEKFKNILRQQNK